MTVRGSRFPAGGLGESVLFDRPWVFLALAAVYALIVLVGTTQAFAADEATYVEHAVNLAHGFYTSSDPQRLNLWAGPGYPLVLLPFAAAHLPWLAAKLLNVLFLVGAVACFHATLRLYAPAGKAAGAALMFALYPPFLRHLHMLMTETLAIFLSCAFLCCFCRLACDKGSRRANGIVAAVALGWLALTKVIFGYVLLGVIVIGLPGLLVHQLRMRKFLPVLVAALVLCTPYLAYTWALTGKVFYWSNAGGLQLYWMSTPYEGELGDWHDWETLPVDSPIRLNHAAVFTALEGLGTVQRDGELRRRAARNIAEHPVKYLRNWGANISRLLLSFPFTDTPQKLSTFLFMAPYLPVVMLLILGAYPAAAGWRQVPPEIAVAFMIGMVAVAASSLVSAYPRQLIPIVPFLAVGEFFVFVRLVDIRLTGSDEAVDRGHAR